MDVTIAEVVSLLTNVGFPTAICLILLRYVLQTMVDKMEKMEKSLNKLSRSVTVSVVKKEGDSEHSGE